MNLEFSEDAAQWHMSHQGGLNVQSHVAREKEDTMSGARMGAVPWQIRVLSGCLLVYEIFAGVYSAEQLPVVVRFPAGPQVSLKVVTSRKAPGTDHKKMYSAEQLEARSLRITADHLKRAFALMKIAGS